MACFRAAQFSIQTRSTIWSCQDDSPSWKANESLPNQSPQSPQCFLLIWAHPNAAGGLLHTSCELIATVVTWAKVDSQPQRRKARQIGLRDLGPPHNNGRSPYLSCLQLPHSHTTWSERLNKSDVCRILAIMHIKLRIQIHPGHHTAMILSVSSWLCETCPCLPHPYHILTQARAQRAPNCQECQQRQGDQPNELWRFTKYWHNHPRHLPLWIRSHELLLEWWSSIIIYPNECEVGVPQLQQKNWHTHLLKAGSLFQKQPKWWDLSLMPHPSTEAVAESPPMQEKMDGNVLPTKTCSFLSVH